MARKNKQEGVGFGLKQVLAALSLFVPAVPFVVLRGRMSGLPVDDFERGESSTKREEKIGGEKTKSTVHKKFPNVALFGWCACHIITVCCSNKPAHSASAACALRRVGRRP